MSYPKYGYPPISYPSPQDVSSTHSHQQPAFFPASFPPPNSANFANSDISSDSSSIAPSSNSQKQRLDQVIQQFYSKVAQLLVQSRLSHPSLTQRKKSLLFKPGSADDAVGLFGRGGSDGIGAGSSPPTRKVNKWFNLELEDLPQVRDEMRYWKANVTTTQPAPPLLIDVFLDISELASHHVLTLVDELGHRKRISEKFLVERGPDGKETRKSSILLETWQLTLSHPPPTQFPDLPTLYTHCISFFRSLYSYVHLIPCHSLFKELKKDPKSLLKIGYRLCHDRTRVFSECGLDQVHLSDIPNITEFTFEPISTPAGVLSLHCTYRSSVLFGLDTDINERLMIGDVLFEENYFLPGQGSVVNIPREQPNSGRSQPQTARSRSSSFSSSPAYSSYDPPPPFIGSVSPSNLTQSQAFSQSLPHTIHRRFRNSIPSSPSFMQSIHSLQSPSINQAALPSATPPFYIPVHSPPTSTNEFHVSAHLNELEFGSPPFAADGTSLANMTLPHGGEGSFPRASSLSSMRDMGFSQLSKTPSRESLRVPVGRGGSPGSVTSSSPAMKFANYTPPREFVDLKNNDPNDGDVDSFGGPFAQKLSNEGEESMQRPRKSVEDFLDFLETEKLVFQSRSMVGRSNESSGALALHNADRRRSASSIVSNHSASGVEQSGMNSVSSIGGVKLSLPAKIVHDPLLLFKSIAIENKTFAETLLAESGILNRNVGISTSPGISGLTCDSIARPSRGGGGVAGGPRNPFPTRTISPFSPSHRRPSFTRESRHRVTSNSSGTVNMFLVSSSLSSTAGREKSNVGSKHEEEDELLLFNISGLAEGE